jgi:hypothetical protein
VRGVRPIVSASHRVVRDGGGPRPDLAEAVDGLAEALRSLNRWMESGDSQTRTEARRDAVRAAALAAALPTEGIGPGTIAHLVQGLARGTLHATGLDAASAQTRLAAQPAPSTTST